MKKFYLLASAIFAFGMGHIMAQDWGEVLNWKVDFEDLQLPEESYYNGADEAGGFFSGGLYFVSNYNAEWDMGSGWAYSNMTDTQTAGFMNQYSAITGSGAEESANYAIYTPDFEVDTLFVFTEPTLDPDVFHHYYWLDSLKITNTTYAYLSMRDGDMFAKQFGSPFDANGEEDGTNGEDYFYVTFKIHYWEEGREPIEKDIYLADFRDENPDNHYVLNEWMNIVFEDDEGYNVSYITFSFTSSDIGEFGMNTPAYFAIDDIYMAEIIDPINSVKEEAANAVLIYPNPATSTFQLKGPNGNYNVFSINGEKVLSFGNQEFSNVDVSILNAGIYIVKSENPFVETKKLVIR